MKERIEEFEKALAISEEVMEKLYTIDDEYIRQATVISLIDAVASDQGMTSKEWMEDVIPMTVLADLMFGRTESWKGDDK